MNVEAERMLSAFVNRGLELRLDDIVYHADGKDTELDRLQGIKGPASESEVSTKEP